MTIKNFIDTVLTELSRVFNCIFYDLHIAKPFPYGLVEHAVTFVISYLMHVKKGAKVNDIELF